MTPSWNFLRLENAPCAPSDDYKPSYNIPWHQPATQAKAPLPVSSQASRSACQALFQSQSSVSYNPPPSPSSKGTMTSLCPPASMQAYAAVGTQLHTSVYWGGSLLLWESCPYADTAYQLSLLVALFLWVFASQLYMTRMSRI